MPRSMPRPSGYCRCPVETGGSSEAYFAENENVRRQLLAVAANYEELAKTVELVTQTRTQVAS
jgi:hypothetical protein